MWVKGNVGEAACCIAHCCGPLVGMLHSVRYVSLHYAAAISRCISHSRDIHIRHPTVPGLSQGNFIVKSVALLRVLVASTATTMIVTLAPAPAGAEPPRPITTASALAPTT